MNKRTKCYTYLRVFTEEQEDGSVIKSVTFWSPISVGKALADRLSMVGQTTGASVKRAALQDIMIDRTWFERFEIIR